MATRQAADVKLVVFACEAGDLLVRRLQAGEPITDEAAGA
jgi:hypothetical protein